MSEETKGADNNQRLLAAAREDNEDLLQEVFSEGGYDINFHDGLGNTALHYAVSHGSTDVLELLLEHDGCDVDPINRLEKATPLLLAVQLENKALRKHVINSLLEAGADTRIKDKNGDTVLSFLSDTPEDREIKDMLRKSQAQAAVSMDDVASDGEEGSGSSSGSGSDED
ncbi:hypothetical protein EWM64_g8316 [Hericium alpestre]|uniref:Uncharacterized protein n=1 Tax=Hericium alpestre TaxID=135208 RepID=A0A4Y9ZM49_9AGAM|nr:hypothetical protein EWM64_g8316 [Hericium alpestre]